MVHLYGISSMCQTRVLSSRLPPGTSALLPLSADTPVPAVVWWGLGLSQSPGHPASKNDFSSQVISGGSSVNPFVVVVVLTLPLPRDPVHGHKTEVPVTAAVAG